MADLIVPLGSLPGTLFWDGDPDDGAPIPAAFFNKWQAWLLAVVDAAGLVRDVEDNGQMVDAINALISEAIGGIGDIDLTPYARTGAVQDWTALQSCAVSVLADAATIAWDLSAAQMAQVTIAASRTLALPTNMRAGARAELTVLHSAAGTTLSFASGYTGITGLALSTTAGAVDVLTWRCTGTSMRLVGVALNVGA